MIRSLNGMRVSESESGVLQVAILEKAFAKLYGSYSALEKGYPEDALSALTGLRFFTLLLIYSTARRHQFERTKTSPQVEASDLVITCVLLSQ